MSGLLWFCDCRPGSGECHLMHEARCERCGDFRPNSEIEPESTQLTKREQLAAIFACRLFDADTGQDHELILSNDDVSDKAIKQADSLLKRLET